MRLSKRCFSIMFRIDSILSFSIFSAGVSPSGFSMENILGSSSFSFSFLGSFSENPFIDSTTNRKIPPIAIKTLFKIVSPVQKNIVQHALGICVIHFQNGIDIVDAMYVVVHHMLQNHLPIFYLSVDFMQRISA